LPYGLLPADAEGLPGPLAPVAAELRHSRILLTGGTGFIGRWLISGFSAMRRAYGIHAELCVLSRDPAAFLRSCPEHAGQDGLTFLTGDIRSFASASDMAFDLVIHGATAASATMSREQPGEMYSVIVDGTRRVCDVAKGSGARRLLYLSSGAMYGPQPPELSHIPESYAGNPTTAYGQGKQAAEALSLEVPGVECVIVRPFAFVGPHLPLTTTYAIGNFMRDCLLNRTIVIEGDGTPLRSYLYAADMAEWLWTMLVHGKPGRAYNLGSDEALSILDLAHLVRGLAGTSNEILVKGSPQIGLLPSRYVPDVRLARTELGLRIRTTLAEAVTRTLAWHRAQPHGSIAI